jgi:hypothetical protein
MTDEKLPRELVWDRPVRGDRAHVSDVGLTAMADGQEAIVGDDAVEHVGACEWCTGRLGRIALLSSHVGEAMALARSGKEDRVSPADAPRPWRALAAGVAVAMLAAIPTARDVLRAPGVAAALATHGVKVLARGGVALATSDAVARGLPPATLVASALLVLMGWSIARWVSRGAAVVSKGSGS